MIFRRLGIDAILYPPPHQPLSVISGEGLFLGFTIYEVQGLFLSRFPNVAALILGAIAMMVPQGLSSMAKGGPLGFTEVLYYFGEAAKQ